MRILVANFFPAFHPPRSGGEQRYYYLYHYLSRNFDVTLLSPTYSNHALEVVTFSPTFREHRVPKDQVFDRLHWTLGNEGIGPECSAYVVALAAATDTTYGRRFETLVAHADLIIHESPFTFPYDRSVGTDGKPRIYNAYNVEHRLAAQILRGAQGRKAVEFIHFLEQSLVSASSLVLATSEEERGLFVSDFGIDRERVALAPNGFEPTAADKVATETPSLENVDGKPYTVFMGSAHPPNVEAAHFIVQQLAPAMPDVEFRLIGSVCSHLPSTLPRNVKSLGFVEEPEKRRQLEQCRAALNPLFSGAGTNLKMFDYMAAGAPIVSTPIGARGLAVEDGVDAFIATSQRYDETLRRVLADKPAATAVGETAKRKAFAQYTWEHIAERARGAIESVIFSRTEVSSERASTRPLLLVVNDFPLSHSTGGGHVRIRELLTELGREFDIVFLCLTSDVQRFDGAPVPGVVEVGIPKTAEHRRAEVRAGRGALISVDDIIASEFCGRNAEFVAMFRMHAGRCAAVIFEHPYLAPMVDFVAAGKPVVYSALNVERDLKAALLAPRPDVAQRMKAVRALEKRLLDRSDLVICVSKADRARFVESHPEQRYEVIANGVRIDLPGHTPGDRSATDVRLGGRALALFLGSGHMPNIDAAKFLLKVVAPAVPEVTFGIIGSVCDAVRLVPQPRNVVLFGTLPEAEKNLLLARATFAVNPMLEGGGSSLKVPDFFAARLAVVSTRVGARGYDLSDGENYLAAERDEFAAKTRTLAGDATLRKRLANNARLFAENALDWRVLGARYRRTLRSLIAPDANRRALVVTYRFADPPPGGAETFLVNVLRELGRREKLAVDVATCDVGNIANKWHFSAEYSTPNGSGRNPAYVGQVFRFAVDAPQDGDFARCQRLFAVWMAESRMQAAMLAIQYAQPVLLGGWNFPEIYAGKTARWASREAQIQVGERAGAISVAGFAPKRVSIEVLRGGTEVAKRDVSGGFEWLLDLPGDDPVVVLRTEQIFSVDGDPRELGFIVSAICVKEGTQMHPVDLADDFGTVARKHEPQRWVQSLIEITGRRDPSDDDLFIAVRGPHSAELRQWLEDNVASYDVVLAQGVPFSTPVTVTEIAARQGVPVVLLPHFHMEDRYYHWRRYYEMFRRAQCVIAAPTQAKSMFFDVLGATSTPVPGGGVDLREYDASNLRAYQQAFRARHTGTKRFALVLGRKAGGKNYQMAIDATLAVNRDGHRLDLVLIGPDDDGMPVTAPNTYYYGAQPRDVVLGALSLAMCLVNMSESESFGIVLLESWLSGRPVVAQRKCMAFAELVVSGENGILVESSSEIVAALEHYLSRPEVAMLHAENGGAMAQKYSWASIASEIEAILLTAAQSSDDSLPESIATAPRVH